MQIQTIYTLELTSYSYAAIWKLTACKATNTMNLNLLDQFKQSHNLTEPWNVALLTVYTAIFLIVMACNLIVIVAAWRRYNKCKIELGTRKRTESSRCILIIYLALLDILLGLTIPMIAIDLLTIDWPFSNPSIDWMCRYTKFLPAMLIYAMSMLVILIAVDSYRNICQPLEPQLTPTSSGYILIAILVLSIFFSLPLFYASQMIFVPVGGLPSTRIEDGGINMTQGNQNAHSFNISQQTILYIRLLN